MDAYALTHHDPSNGAPTHVVGFVVIDDADATAYATFVPFEEYGFWHARFDAAVTDTAERLGPQGSRIDAAAARTASTAPGTTGGGWVMKVW